MYDTKVPYTSAQLRKLYGSYAGYTRRFEAAKAAAIKERYLLIGHAADLAPVAKPDNF